MKTLEQFINEQPDERPIDFKQAVAHSSECGCLLIHYGRAAGLVGTLSCGYEYVYQAGHATDAKTIDIPDRLFARRAVSVGTSQLPKTYGQLRALLA